jgi:hypothetical protein
MLQIADGAAGRVGVAVPPKDAGGDSSGQLSFTERSMLDTEYQNRCEIDRIATIPNSTA